MYKFYYSLSLLLIFSSTFSDVLTDLLILWKKWTILGKEPGRVRGISGRIMNRTHSWVKGERNWITEEVVIRRLKDKHIILSGEAKKKSFHDIRITLLSWMFKEIGHESGIMQGGLKIKKKCKKIFRENCRIK